MDCFTCVSRSMRSLSRRSNVLVVKPTHVQQQWRTESTARRLRKSLRVHTAPSFKASAEETTDHIIFNPPSSVPNVYHTPVIFLPQTDPRRQLHTLPETTPSTNAAASSVADDALGPTRRLALSRLGRSSSGLPPPIQESRERKYHLGPEDVQEIRRLRASDPVQWSVHKLAKRFNCHTFFIQMCSSSPQTEAAHWQRIEEVKKKWGRTKREAREDRQTRKELWGTAD